MKFTLSQTFTFDSAHTLDRSESSRRVHGHTYHAEISVTGERDPETGMVVDLTHLRHACEDIRAALDHRLLDDVEGLGPATMENLCAFIAQHCEWFGGISSVRVWRADGGCASLVPARGIGVLQELVALEDLAKQAAALSREFFQGDPAEYVATEKGRDVLARSAAMQRDHDLRYVLAMAAARALAGPTLPAGATAQTTDAPKTFQNRSEDAPPSEP